MLDLIASERTTTTLRHTQIRTNGGTQMRAGLNETTAAEYADELRRGAVLPPVIVFFDGSDYWLGDGFHRVRAHFMAGGSDAEIPCEVRPGTRRDAVLCAAQANASHGLRRTLDDKRRAVDTLLRDEEWGKWSDRKIAESCHVSHTFVAGRRDLIPVVTGNVASDERTYTTRHGTTTTMNVAGQRQAAAERAQADEPKTLTLDETIAVLWRAIKADTASYLDAAGNSSATDEQRLQSLFSRGGSLARYWPFHGKDERLDSNTFARAYTTVKAELQGRIEHAAAKDERRETQPNPTQPVVVESPALPERWELKRTPAGEWYATSIWHRLSTARHSTRELAIQAVIDGATSRENHQYWWQLGCLRSVPANDINFKSARDEATIELLQEALIGLENTGNKSRLDALEARLRQLQRTTPAPVVIEAPPAPAPATATPTRNDRLSRLLDLYRQVATSASEYGDLTGDHTGTLPLRRALEPMIAKLLDNLGEGTVPA